MTYRFESFELDTDRYELRRDGKPIAVEPQVFSVLTMLVENRHRMVPREEIIETVWSGRAVSDSVLSSRIKSARQALDDDGNAQRLIKTVHGQGFRFVGDVESTAAAPASAPTAAQALVREVLARPVIAVLPFEADETVSREAEDAYFADGIAEELIAELSSWRWFPILSRDSSFDRSRAALPASARAAAMGARYAVAGRLARGGDSLRLTVELLDTATDTQLWSARYDVRAAELARTQSEIASEIFRRIAPELTSEETRRVMRKRHEDLTAWDLTIKGLWQLHRATKHDYRQALELLEDATRVDPGFALPWSVIAQARFEQALAGWKVGQRVGSREEFRGVLDAASTAVELDPSSWMGHTLMSAAELWVNLSFPRARLHVNRALELNPSASMAHHVSGCICGLRRRSRGRDRRAVQRLSRGSALRPRRGRRGRSRAVAPSPGRPRVRGGAPAALGRPRSVERARPAETDRSRGAHGRRGPRPRGARRCSRSSEDRWTSGTSRPRIPSRSPRTPRRFRKGLEAAGKLGS